MEALRTQQVKSPCPCRNGVRRGTALLQEAKRKARASTSSCGSPRPPPSCWHTSPVHSSPQGGTRPLTTRAWLQDTFTRASSSPLLPAVTSRLYMTLDQKASYENQLKEVVNIQGRGSAHTGHWILQSGGTGRGSWHRLWGEQEMGRVCTSARMNPHVTVCPHH